MDKIEDMDKIEEVFDAEMKNYHGGLNDYEVTELDIIQYYVENNELEKADEFLKKLIAAGYNIDEVFFDGHALDYNDTDKKVIQILINNGIKKDTKVRPNKTVADYVADYSIEYKKRQEALEKENSKQTKEEKELLEKLKEFADSHPSIDTAVNWWADKLGTPIESENPDQAMFLNAFALLIKPKNQEQIDTFKLKLRNSIAQHLSGYKKGSIRYKEVVLSTDYDAKGDLAYALSVANLNSKSLPIKTRMIVTADSVEIQNGDEIIHLYQDDTLSV